MRITVIVLSYWGNEVNGKSISFDAIDAYGQKKNDTFCSSRQNEKKSIELENPPSCFSAYLLLSDSNLLNRRKTNWKPLLPTVVLVQAVVKNFSFLFLPSEYLPIDFFFSRLLFPFSFRLTFVSAQRNLHIRIRRKRKGRTILCVHVCLRFFFASLVFCSFFYLVCDMVLLSSLLNDISQLPEDRSFCLFCFVMMSLIISPFVLDNLRRHNRKEWWHWWVVIQINKQKYY